MTTVKIGRNKKEKKDEKEQQCSVKFSVELLTRAEFEKGDQKGAKPWFGVKRLGWETISLGNS